MTRAATAVAPASGLAETVRFLERPASYPDWPERVETEETHMAWVFLTDRFAYKPKKPVRYDYLDFSTVEARRRDGLEEVRLNRRLAAGVYLGILPLTREEEDVQRAARLLAAFYRDAPPVEITTAEYRERFRRGVQP